MGHQQRGVGEAASWLSGSSEFVLCDEMPNGICANLPYWEGLSNLRRGSPSLAPVQFFSRPCLGEDVYLRPSTLQSGGPPLYHPRTPAARCSQTPTAGCPLSCLVRCQPVAVLRLSRLSSVTMGAFRGAKLQGFAGGGLDWLDLKTRH